MYGVVRLLSVGDPKALIPTPLNSQSIRNPSSTPPPRPSPRPHSIGPNRVEAAGPEDDRSLAGHPNISEAPFKAPGLPEVPRKGLWPC